MDVAAINVSIEYKMMAYISSSAVREGTVRQMSRLQTRVSDPFHKPKPDMIFHCA